MGKYFKNESKADKMERGLSYWEIMHEEAGLEEEAYHPDTIFSALDSAESYPHFSEREDESEE